MNAASLSKWLGRESAPAACADETVTEALRWMNADLRTTLGNLHGAPGSIANAVIQLLPFGSRASLERLHIVSADPAIDDKSRRPLTLTDFGYSVIAAAVIANEADPEGVADWSVRATLAAQALEDPAAE